MAIEVTASAAAKITALLDKNPGKTVRIWLTAGGCNGFRKNIDLVSPETGDHLVDSNGVTIAVDPSSLDLIGEAVIDWVSGVAGQHFDIRIPSASSSCGCGDSISL